MCAFRNCTACIRDMAWQAAVHETQADNVMTSAILDDLVETGGYEPCETETFETHLSHVLLAGDRAIKLKKPVKLAFVDFSTLEKRHSACLAELEANRKMGSSLYLDVLPVTQAAGGKHVLDGGGETVDWVVVMKRFDSAKRFDSLVEAGALDPALAWRTADRIVDMHAGLEPVTTAGHAADYRKVIRDLRQTEADGAARDGLSIGEPSPFDLLDTELAHVDPLIEQRRRAGKVRRTHGDLHLRNLCLYEGEVTPFDCLEFDERLATTDVLYDLAFLLMDLLQAGLPEAANRVMNRYWDGAQEDEAALALLPFFMALRASVRMAVAVEGGALAEADRYRRLALTLLKRRKPVFVAIGGLSGTGKSTVAAALAPDLPGAAGARLLRSDVLRKRGQGTPEAGRADREAYAPEQRAKVYRQLAGHAEEALTAGCSVLADATFQEAAAREALESVSAAPLQAFWLETSLATRLERVSNRRGDASDADEAVARQQEEPGQLEPEWRRIDAGRTVDKIAADIARRLGGTADT